MYNNFIVVIDLRIKMSDMYAWKRGMVVDWGEHQPYSTHMQKNFFILTVPDSWLERAKWAVLPVGEDETKATFRKRRGIMNLTQVETKMGVMLRDLDDITKVVAPLDGAKYDISQSIIMDSAEIGGTGPVLTKFSATMDKVVTIGKNFISDFI